MHCIMKCIGNELTPGEIILLMHLTFNNKIGLGLTYNALLSYLFEVSRKDEKKVVEFKELDPASVLKLNTVVLDAKHYVNLQTLIGKTLPFQPRAIQKCIEKAIDQNQIITYNDFVNILLNVGILMTIDQERLLQNMLIEKRLLKLERIMDLSSEFVIDGRGMISLLDIEIGYATDLTGKGPSVPEPTRLSPMQADPNQFGKELTRLLASSIQNVKVLLRSTAGCLHREMAL